MKTATILSGASYGAFGVTCGVCSGMLCEFQEEYGFVSLKVVGVVILGLDVRTQG